MLYLWDADYPWDVRVEKICSALSAGGCEVHIVARNRSRCATTETLPEGIVHRMPPLPRMARALEGVTSFPAFFNPRWLSLLSGVVSQVRPDVIVARDLPLCPTALWAGRRFSLPVVHDMAEHYPAMIREIYAARRQRPLDYLVRNPGIVAAVERQCIRRSNRILVVIEEMRDRLVALGYPAERIDVVSNTPPRGRAAVARQPRAAGGPLRLAYLGIMEIPRGIGDLIEATGLLVASGQPVELTLVGTGRDIPIFEEQARRLGLHGTQVRFFGHVASHEESFRLLAAADIGVLPHRTCDHWNHTIPNKLFDYMALGLPVLTSDAAPFARIVRTVGAGEVFTSRDPRSLADAVMRLAPPDIRVARGEAGRRAVLDHYHWERDAEVLRRSIDTAAGSIRRRP